MPNPVSTLAVEWLEEGCVSLGAGSDGMLDAEGAFNPPLRGAWSACVSARAQRRNDGAHSSVNYAVSPQRKLRAGPSKRTINSKWDRDASATCAHTPDVNLYARVATGFRAASIQAAGPFDTQASAPPESITSYEAGAKAELCDRRTPVGQRVPPRREGSASDGRRRLEQLQRADQREEDAGRGIGLKLTAQLSDNLLLDLATSDNHTRITDRGLEVASCSGGCTATDPIGAAATASTETRCRTRRSGSPTSTCVAAARRPAASGRC